MQDTIPSRNQVTYWDPLAVARQLMGAVPSLPEPATSRITFMPRLEVSETDEGYLVLADVPGLRQDDLDVTVTGNQLTISGERRTENSTRNGTYHVTERSYGKFVRTVTLPADADVNDVSADLDDGVLRLAISKHADSKPRKISLAQRIKNKLKS